jgi:hypothetical protein
MLHGRAKPPVEPGCCPHFGAAQPEALPYLIEMFIQ